MGIKKFDVYEWMLLREDEQEDPNMQQQPQQNPGGEQGSPNQMNQPTNPSQNVFADIKGKVIKSVNFKKMGPNAGQLEIQLADFDIPLVISWVNDRVTASKPPAGEAAPLT